MTSMGAASALGASACSSLSPNDPGEASATRSDQLYGAGVSTDEPDQSPLISAVGQIALTNASCSGTLITRDRVLTSAHCFCDGNVPLSFTLPNTVSYWEPIDLTKGGAVAVHPSYNCSPTPLESLQGQRRSNEIDLAIVVLSTPVPPNVAVPARVYLGDVVAANSWGSVANSQIAGFGATNHFACKPDDFISNCSPVLPLKFNFGPCINDHQRRHGPIGPVTLLTDHCDKIALEGECWPYSLYSMVISDASGAISGPGDSGGPLFAEFQGVPMVYGVTSGWKQNCLDYPDPIALWASTYYDSNDAFIVANAPDAARDLDNDGIMDAVDNCPPSRCGDPAMCWNSDQADLDQDGVGDACDNCSPLKVVKCFADPLACSNPNQLDADKDHRGDICDPCPKNVGDSDSDTDGVPDACDVLKGAKDDPLAVCPNGIGDCPVAIGQECLQDGSNSVCTTPPDVDLDGIADIADLCPTFRSADNANDNLTAENMAAVDRRANPCDPAPILRVKAVYPPKSTKPVPASPSQDFTTTPIVGRVSDQDPTSSFTGSQAFRACTCVAGGGQQLELAECVAPGGPCEGSQLHNGMWWSPMTVTAANGTAVPQAGTTAAFSTSGPGTKQTWTWHWRQDYDNGLISGPLALGRLHAAIAVQAAPPPPWFPQTQRELNNDLRRTFELVETGLVPFQEEKPPLSVDPDWRYCPNCAIWVFDPRLAVDPVDVWPETGVPALLWATADRIRAWEGGGSVDVTAAIPPSLALQLRSRSRLWVKPVESMARLRSMGDTRQAVLVEANLQSALQSVPWQVSSGPEGFAISGRGPATGGPDSVAAGAPVPGELSLSAPVSVTPPDARVLATFSAVANRLFVAGPSEGLSPGLWRYDLSARTWEPALHKAGALPHDQLVDMTYDPNRNVLYVLSFTDRSHIPGDPRWISLIAYDVGGDRSITLASWRLSHKNRATYLTLLDGGDLAVTATTEQTHAVHRFTPGISSLTLRGVHRNGGAVPLAPVVGDRDLIVPVQKGSSQSLRFETITKYPAGGPCAEL